MPAFEKPRYFVATSGIAIAGPNVDYNQAWESRKSVCSLEGAHSNPWQQDAISSVAKSRAQQAQLSARHQSVSATQCFAVRGGQLRLLYFALPLLRMITFRRLHFLFFVADNGFSVEYLTR